MEKKLLLIYLQPGASKDEIVGIYGDNNRLKIKITAPPVDGAANKYLIKYLAKTLGIAKSKIEIIRGHTSRNKDLFIEVSQIKLDELAIISKGTKL